MRNVVPASPPDSKIYGLIFLLGGLLNLVLGWNMLKVSALQNQLNDPLSLFLAVLLQPSAIAFGFLVVGAFALRSSTVTRIWALRLSALIGLVAGGGLGILLGMGIANQGQDALGVGFAIIIPLPVLLMSGTAGIINLLVLLHVLAILLVGIYTCWIARRSGSVKYALWSTLCLALLIAFFAQVVGTITSWIAGQRLGHADAFAYALNWSPAFILLLFQLLAYMLIIGLPVAFLGCRFRLRKCLYE